MAQLRYEESIHLMINKMNKIANLKNIIGIAVFVEILTILFRAISTHSFLAEWRDMGSVVCITFAVSPYGQACAQWVKDKFKGNKK